jgi:FkbM family methyltransferase
MLFTMRNLRGYWRIKPKGVVHVGAHLAEERNAYRENDFGPVIWVEAQKDLAERLKSEIEPPDTVVCALVWSEPGIKMSLNLTNNSQSSSVFEFGSHALDHPDVVMTDRIELITSSLHDIIPENCPADLLVLDIQGAEYQAIVGLGERIRNMNWIYCEVNRAEVYKGIQQIEKLDDVLAKKSFIRLATIWTSANWGEALYAREQIAFRAFGGKLLTRVRIHLFQLVSQFRSSYFVRAVIQLLGFVTPNRSKAQ